MRSAGRIGQKGGTSATAGRKSETISASLDGIVFQKRVFFGQRVLLIHFYDNGHDPLVTAWQTRAHAEANLTGTRSEGERTAIVDANVVENKR